MKWLIFAEEEKFRHFTRKIDLTGKIMLSAIWRRFARAANACLFSQMRINIGIVSFVLTIVGSSARNFTSNITLNFKCSTETHKSDRPNSFSTVNSVVAKQSLCHIQPRTLQW
jgi:hypothetical protein